MAAAGRSGAAFLPDLDGDGLSEVLIGASNPSGFHGSAWLVTGATLQARIGELSLPDVADQELFLDDPGELYLGKSVGLAGDSDGDGTDEIAVGSDGHLWLAPYLPDSGRHNLDASTVVETDCDCSAFGGRWAKSSDLDGDGLDDILLGDFEYPGTFPYDGRVLVFLGGTIPTGTRVLASEADFTALGPSGEGFGSVVNSIGDVDGDGKAEWAVSVGISEDQDQSGLVHIVAGDVVSTATVIEVEDASTRQIVGYPGENIGASIDAGDFDGDGSVDLALRSTNGEEAGRISVVRSYELPREGTLELELESLSFGPREPNDVSIASISMGGDVDGDGRDDLLIGDPGWDQYASSDSDGHAWLVLGF